MTDDKTFTKAEVDAAIAEAKDAQDAKNAELLNEVKKLKADLRKTQDIKPEDVAAIEAERDKALTDLATATKMAKEATAAAEKATKALESEAGFTHRLVAENGLVKALAEAGVTDPAYLEAAKAMHLGNVKVTADGDVRKALYGDKELDAAIKEWAAGDVGKKFVAAPNNSGGGSPGGKGGASTKSLSEQAIAALSPKARAAHFADNGVIADA